LEDSKEEDPGLWDTISKYVYKGPIYQNNSILRLLYKSHILVKYN